MNLKNALILGLAGLTSSLLSAPTKYSSIDALAYATAITYLRQMSKQQPNLCDAGWAHEKPEAQYDLANHYLELTRLGKAVRCLENAAEKGDEKSKNRLEDIRSALEKTLALFQKVEARYTISKLVSKLLNIFEIDPNKCEDIDVKATNAGERASALAEIYEEDGRLAKARHCLSVAGSAKYYALIKQVIDAGKPYDQAKKEAEEAKAPYVAQSEALSAKLNDAASFFIKLLLEQETGTEKEGALEHEQAQIPT